MSNEPFHCNVIDNTVTPATCAVRKERGLCKEGDCQKEVKEDKATKRVKHKKCSEKKCKRLAWKGTYCFKHYYSKHTGEPKPSTKKNIISPVEPIDIKPILSKLNILLAKKKEEILEIENAIRVVEKL